VLGERPSLGRAAALLACCLLLAACWLWLPALQLLATPPFQPRRPAATIGRRQPTGARGPWSTGPWPCSRALAIYSHALRSQAIPCSICAPCPITSALAAPCHAHTMIHPIRHEPAAMRVALCAACRLAHGQRVTTRKRPQRSSSP
jgi:hypothetical protein